MNNQMMTETMFKQMLINVQCKMIAIATQYVSCAEQQQIINTLFSDLMLECERISKHYVMLKQEHEKILYQFNELHDKFEELNKKHESLQMRLTDMNNQFAYTLQM